MTDAEYYQAKLQMLRKHILPASSVLIVAHDYPDPDCLAACLGLQFLLTYWGVTTAQITFGGFIGRAENRAMVRHLGIDMIPMALLDTSEFERVVVVDSYPGNGHVSLPPGQKVDVVIDHHPNQHSSEYQFYYDIRTDLGATSTLMTKYLWAAGCTIPAKVATALFYGIKTDTNEMARNASAEDLFCYRELFDIIDHHILSEIESPDRDAEYFRVIHRATEALVTFDQAAWTHLGKIQTPDYVAEMADFFNSLENNELMVCSGIFKKQIFFSIRTKTTHTAGKTAATIARTLKGFGGGHTTMAAGRIPLANAEIPEDEASERFLSTFKSVCNIDDSAAESILLN